jgi:hypothetical protein
MTLIGKASMVILFTILPVCALLVGLIIVIPSTYMMVVVIVAHRVYLDKRCTFLRRVRNSGNFQPRGESLLQKKSIEVFILRGNYLFCDELVGWNSP